MKNKAMEFSPMIALTYNCNQACKNCYPSGLEKKFCSFITLKNFSKAIDWFKSQNITENIMLTGGEPTIHPDFLEILKICRDKKIKITILTNCLFEEKILKNLNLSFVNSLIVNYFSLHDQNINHEKYENNLKKLSEKKISLSFFYKLPVRENEKKDLVEKSKAYNAKIFGHFLMPGFSGKKISFENRKKEMRSVISLTKLIDAENLRFELLEPLLRCAFSDKEWKFLKNFYCQSKIGHSRCYVGEDYHALTEKKSNYAMRIFINPDLSIFPCFPVFFKGPSILSFKNITEASNLLKMFFEKWRWEVPFDEKCEKCHYFLKRECQGGCLHYKYHKFYEKNKNIVNFYNVI
jgi:MoaA/NifB/PqqE/SkfB family radical SAM enzyme